MSLGLALCAALGVAACAGGISADSKGRLATGKAQAAPATQLGSTYRVPGLNGIVIVMGLEQSPAPIPATYVRPARLLYLDSANGDDRNDGRSATPGGPTSGPWRTLSRLRRADIRPGDQIVLACGGLWRETLWLPAGGSELDSVVIGAPRSGCAADAMPTIDGAVPVPATAWSHEGGSVWKSTAATPVLHLLQPGRVLLPAHHPNRGHDATDPRSPYLRVAAAGNQVAYAGGTGSDRFTVGPDLHLPPGVRLTDGAQVHIRTNAWHIDEAAVSSFSGTQLTLGRPTAYPIGTGWGYYLTGQSWMLDSPGEWHHDPRSGVLRVWMPDSERPGATLRAVTLPTAVDLEGRSHVVIEGIAIRGAGRGLNLRGTRNVQVRKVLIEDILNDGLDAAGSRGVTVESSSFVRIGANAIEGGGRITSESIGLVVRNNLVRDSGVQMQGDEVLSLPRLAFAAILGARDAIVSENVVINSGYIGIRVRSGSRVEDNYVFGACSTLDDCAGIYVWNDPDVLIRGNVVMRSRGYSPGRPPRFPNAAQGIYLDEAAHGVRVENNTVIDADHGIQVHVSNDNTLRGNLLYGNRSSQIWLQASRAVRHPDGDLFNNRIIGNAIAPANPSAVGLKLETPAQTTSAFASFADNAFFDRVSATVIDERTRRGHRALDMHAWQRSSGVGSAADGDSAGKATSPAGFGTMSIAGPNVIPNGNLERGLEGWTHWNATPPAGKLKLEPCGSQNCVRYQPGGSSGLLISPNFSVEAGRWYRLTVDLAADVDGQDVNLVLRRGGGGPNGYETISARPLHILAASSLSRYATAFQVTRTVNMLDQVTGDRGARLDIEGLMTGRSVSVARMELVPIQYSQIIQGHGVLINASKKSVQVACPLEAYPRTLCESVFDLSTHRPVNWPIVIAARRTFGFYLQNTGMVDEDRDGVIDVEDQCVKTPLDQAVDATGCAILQMRQRSGQRQ